MLGFIVTICIFDRLDKFEKLQEEHKQLKIQAEIEKRKRSLRYSSLDSLIEQRQKIESELSNRKKKSFDSELPSEDESEIQILKEVLDEFEYLIDQAK